MCYKFLIFISLIYFLSISGFTQNSNQKKFSALLELGGKSGVYSMNGEYEIADWNNIHMNLQLGAGYLPIKNITYLSIPAGINIIWGNSKHHLEGGFGISYSQGLTYKYITGENLNQYFGAQALYFVPSFGYRYDKFTKGLIFKVYYSPLLMLQDLFNEEDFINDVTKNVTTIGDATKQDWFDYVYGESLYPKAKSHYALLGISLGFRF